MSDTVKNLADNGMTELIDVVDTASKAAVAVVEAARATVLEGAAGVVRLSDNVSEDLISEINTQREALIANLRKAAESVTAPLESLP